jgi:hypothetical protein
MLTHLLTFGRRPLGIQTRSQARARRRPRPALQLDSLEGRLAPAQLTVVGPVYVVAQVQSGTQSPKTASAKFGGVGVADIDVHQPAVNLDSEAYFHYQQKPPAVVLGFNLAMSTRTSSLARDGSWVRSAIVTRTSPTMGPAQAITVRIDQTPDDHGKQDVTVHLGESITGGGSNLPKASVFLQYRYTYKGVTHVISNGEVKQGRYVGTTFKAHIGETFQLLVETRSSSNAPGVQGAGVSIGAGAG